MPSDRTKVYSLLVLYRSILYYIYIGIYNVRSDLGSEDNS